MIREFQRPPVCPFCNPPAARGTGYPVESGISLSLDYVSDHVSVLTKIHRRTAQLEERLNGLVDLIRASGELQSLGRTEEFQYKPPVDTTAPVNPECTCLPTPRKDAPPCPVVSTGGVSRLTLAKRIRLRACKMPHRHRLVPRPSTTVVRPASPPHTTPSRRRHASAGHSLARSRRPRPRTNRTWQRSHHA